MDIFRMRCFVSVAQTQSLSKASHEQFITQPAMSAQMKALESEMGTQLLRRGRTISLTPAGQVAFERFSRIIDEYDAARRAIALEGDHMGGLLRIGFHGPVSWAGVPDMVRAYRGQNPNVEVDIEIDTWNNLMKRLDDGKLDVAFMELSEIEGQSAILADPLFEECVCVVMPPSHPLAGRDTVSVMDIVDEPMMLFSPETSPRFFRKLYAAFERIGIHTDKVVRGNHHEATISLVHAGCGITCMPQTFCREYTGIASVPFSDLATHMRYGVAWNKARVSSVGSSFVDFARGWVWPQCA
ncbi:hypothetical protein AAY81_07880 [Denitrobacterium detoxificans]|uniref:DNA-binding transcriptional regulator, LysR family n=1 Tax=Denitrobacterium detoxificans TaxID=79604 RepID=A0A172RZ69_9ACTN|nr:LysR family transcriptional regulator [Denitrobacterium detoxificans]ANE23041.1 hypothetical protein AAY81_07880 [Denitrobacterium detoxificans]SEO51063.1 DNA-binding transcriptional regulator, LysR family [Denitrobacterium detoxificans]